MCILMVLNVKLIFSMWNLEHNGCTGIPAISAGVVVKAKVSSHRCRVQIPATLRVGFIGTDCPTFLKQCRLVVTKSFEYIKATL